MSQPQISRERLFPLVTPAFKITRGRPLPLGAHVLCGGINFLFFQNMASKSNSSYLHQGLKSRW
jgi:hypothetical protein